MVFWTTWKAHSFLWGDGYDPWSQFATSTINFWTLHHHSGCVSNGWRSGGGRHGESAWGSLPGTVYGKKNLTAWVLGKELFFIPCCLPVHIGSRKAHWRLLWEESVLKKEKEILLRQECKQTKKDNRNMCFCCVCNTNRVNMESWEGRQLRNDWILWVLMENVGHLLIWKNSWCFSPRILCFCCVRLP